MIKQALLDRLDVLMTRIEENNYLPIDLQEIRDHINMLADMISTLPADEHSNQQQLKGLNNE